MGRAHQSVIDSTNRVGAPSRGKAGPGVMA